MYRDKKAYKAGSIIYANMKDGDFVEIDFVGKVKDTGEIFDLTSEAEAKKEGIYDKEHKYGPVLVVVGSKSVVPGVEEKIREMSVGEEKEFGLGYEKAFGKREPKLIQILALNKFYQQKLNPVPGAFVQIDGRTCRIQSVSGGRVRVDFNSPLAGKDVLYRLKIVREVKELKEKVESVIKYLGLEGEAKVEDSSVSIKLKKTNKILEQVVEKTLKTWIKDGLKEIKFEGEGKTEIKTEAPNKDQEKK